MIELDRGELRALVSDGTLTATITPNNFVSTIRANSLTLQLDYPSLITPEVYSFSLDTGDTVELVASSEPTSQLRLELLSPAGAVMARGVQRGLSNERSIASIVATESGTYFARVNAHTDYGLVVAMGAVFDAERNNDLQQAQDLTYTAAALGSVGLTPMGRLFLWKKHSEQIFEIDPQTGDPLRYVGVLGDTHVVDAKLATSADLLLIVPRRQLPRTIVYHTDLRDPEVAPDDDAGLVRRFQFGTDGIVVWKDEIFIGSQVYDYRTGDLKRTIDIGVTGAMYATETGLQVASTADNAVYEIDHLTGQSTFLSSIDLSFRVRSATTVGDELFIMGDPPPHNGTLAVYDLATFTLQRTISYPIDHPETGFYYYAIGGGPGSSDDDYYSVRVNAGDVLTIQTSTPRDVAGEAPNVLDAKIELIDPSGALVDSDNNGAADGRNARLVHTAGETGVYTVRVLSADGRRGDYLLTVDGHQGAIPPFTVVSSSVPDSAVVTRVPGQLTLDFSRDVQLDSVQAADLTVDGVPAVDVVMPDGDTAVFTLPAIGLGDMHVHIDAGTIVDDLARPLGSYDITFTTRASPAAPRGSLAYEWQSHGHVPVAGSTQPFGLFLDEAQQVTIVVEADGGLQPAIELRDTAGTTIATATAAAGDSTALVQSIEASEAGRYDVIVSGAASTTGTFTARVLLNAAAESEDYGGADNDSIASAQNVDDAFASL